MDPQSPVGVLFTGYGQGIGNILGGMNVTTDPMILDGGIKSLVDDTSLNNLNNLKILFIGSSAGSQISSSVSISSQIANFVYNGGTVVSFSQQDNASFGFLPRWNEFQAVGFQADMLSFTNAVYLSGISPVFNNMASANVNASVDGYFTQWPKDATVLLSRKQTGCAELIQYSYGKGKVFVSGLYSDYQYYSTGSLSADEKNIIAGFVQYASTPTMAANPNQPVGAGGGTVALSVVPDQNTYYLGFTTQSVITLSAVNEAATPKTIAYQEICTLYQNTLVTTGTFIVPASTSAYCYLDQVLNAQTLGLRIAGSGLES